MTYRAILIAGPTASGKSGWALDLARRLDSEIVNADSMQMYKELRTITARPSVEAEAMVPHHLYGVLSLGQVCSAGRWLEMLDPVLKDLRKRGKTAIIVGGTGLYFQAALKGLAPIPDIPKEVRDEARALLAKLGPAGLHERLSAADPATAAGLRPSDAQRIVRAWEVWQATGRPLTHWRKIRGSAPLGNTERQGQVEKLALLPERRWLYERIDRRFEEMVRAGALAEVAHLAEMGMSSNHPAMKALGIAPLLAHLKGETDLATAIAEGQKQTRRYAKRQITWIRHQFADWKMVNAQEMERLSKKMFSLI